MKQDEVELIAEMLTDDPDLFNEMAVGTGAIAMGPGHQILKKEDDEDKQEKPKVSPVTGKPTSEKDQVLFSDKTSDS